MRVVLLLALTLLSAPATGEVPKWLAGELSLSTGFDYSDGKFGDTHHTDILFVPFSVSYLFDHFAATPYANDLFEVKLTIPWVLADGPGIPDDGGTAESLRDTRRHGVGDIVLGIGYLLFPGVDSPLPAFEFGTRVKIPTASNADDRLLGTGSPTYTLQVDLYKQIGRVTPLLAAGYRLAPAGKYNVHNAAFTSFGAAVRVVTGLSVGLTYDWYDRTSRSSKVSHELFPFLTLRLRDDLRVSPYAILSVEGSDWGTGLQLRFTIPIR